MPLPRRHQLAAEPLSPLGTSADLVIPAGSRRSVARVLHRSLEAVAVGLVAALFFTGPAEAQDRLLEPAELGVPMQRQGDRFTSLEMQRVRPLEPLPLLALVAQRTLELPGARSPVRFAAGDTPLFFFRSLLGSSDPRAALVPRDPRGLSLVRFDVSDGIRRLPLERIGLLATRPEMGQPLLQRLYGGQSFVLSPAQPLEPGEYALIDLTRNPEPTTEAVFDLFCFGIDP